MKRWGFIGLMVLAGCMPDDSEQRDALRNVCPGINAGALPQEPRTTQKVASEDDGREPVIIRYRQARSVTAARVHQLGGRVTASFRHAPALAARVTPEERLALALDPSVESIEPDAELRATGLGALPLGALTRVGLGASGTGDYTGKLQRVQALEVWDRDGDGVPDPGAVTGAGVRVCVIDSGMDMNHPELRDAVVAARDFLDGDDDATDGEEGHWGTGHGTHVAGIIAARAGMGGQGGPVLTESGLMGVAPGAQLLVARVLDLNGRTNMSVVLEAVEWCMSQGARVASLSLAGGLATFTSEDIFKAALDGGMLVVAAAGNEGQFLVSYPASDPSVLAVGAVDDLDRRVYFSSHGERLALMAPGVDVLSTFPRGLGSFAQLELGRARPASRSLLYAPTGNTWGALVDCGHGGTLDSCGEDSSCDGFIAYLHPHPYVRPERAMVNVMKQGARAVIFASELAEGGAEILSVPQHGAWVPAVTITQAASTVMGRQLGATTRLTLRPVDYAYMSGTSMATPYVSGIAALLFSARPGATPAQVRAALQSSAKDLGAPGYDTEHGHGLVQARGAMEALIGAMP